MGCDGEGEPKAKGIDADGEGREGVEGQRLAAEASRGRGMGSVPIWPRAPAWASSHPRLQPPADCSGATAGTAWTADCAMPGQDSSALGAHYCQRVPPSTPLETTRHVFATPGTSLTPSKVTRGGKKGRRGGGEEGEGGGRGLAPVLYISAAAATLGAPAQSDSPLKI